MVGPAIANPSSRGDSPLQLPHILPQRASPTKAKSRTDAYHDKRKAKRSNKSFVDTRSDSRKALIAASRRGEDTKESYKNLRQQQRSAARHQLLDQHFSKVLLSKPNGDRKLDPGEYGNVRRIPVVVIIYSK